MRIYFEVRKAQSRGWGEVGCGEIGNFSDSGTDTVIAREREGWCLSILAAKILTDACYVSKIEALLFGR